MGSARKRVCLLTGASGRLGTRFCQKHASDYEIIAVYRRADVQVSSQNQSYVDALDPKRRLPENEHPVYAVQADVTNENDVRRLVEVAMARYGAIDLIIHSAVHSVWGSLLETQSAIGSARSQFTTNVVAPLHLTSYVARTCWRDSPAENRLYNRNVINVSSLAGVKIFRGWGQSVYSASKAALNFLTWHMADEFEAIGVRVNALAPDAFPRKISTDHVVESLIHLDQGSETGQVVAMTDEGDFQLERPTIHPRKT